MSDAGRVGLWISIVQPDSQEDLLLCDEQARPIRAVLSAKLAETRFQGPVKRKATTHGATHPAGHPLPTKSATHSHQTSAAGVGPFTCRASKRRRGGNLGCVDAEFIQLVRMRTTANDDAMPEIPFHG